MSPSARRWIDIVKDFVTVGSAVAMVGGLIKLTLGYGPMLTGVLHTGQAVDSMKQQIVRLQADMDTVKPMLTVAVHDSLGATSQRIVDLQRGVDRINRVLNERGIAFLGFAGTHDMARSWRPSEPTGIVATDHSNKRP